MLMHGKRSILFIKPIVIYCNIFGVIPLYNFEKREVSINNWYYSWVALHWMFMLVMLIYEYFVKCVELKAKNSEYVFLIFETITTLLGTLTIFMMLFNGHCKTKQWEELFRRISFMENIVNLNTEHMKETNFFKCPFLHFICINFIFFILNITRVDSKYFPLNHRQITFYYSFLYLLIQSNFTSSILYKYEDINRNLLKLRKANVLQSTTALRRIKKCRKMYHEMGKIIGILNDLFGFPLFSIYGFCGCQILYLCTDVYVIVAIPTHMAAYSWPLNSALVTVLVVLTLWITSIHYDMVSSQSNKLVTTCYAIQKNLNIFCERRQELVDFCDQIEMRKVKFSAARFFTINRSVIFTHVSVAASYFIVIVQFLNADKKDRELS
ncbi:gustatory receptor family protein 3-like [Cylas formicarius]|uniref:gustatory receptor family protein 3-like n=1 Tax=Cylas formicarius TaxID=197179 RepID=UPI0029587DBF|nr:gustatory receptor family protein 3-like [Cylas formicarius]